MTVLHCRTHGLTLLLSIVLMTGCATPDLKPFAAETASLGSAIAGEQAEIQGRFAKAGARAAARDQDDPLIKNLKAQEQRYAASAAAIDAVMAVAVNYSSTLVDLAAEGETGGAAVDALAKSLQGLSTAVGVAIPVVGNIPDWAGKLIKEIAQDVTRIQAQKSLAAAAKAADPAVDRIAKAIAQVYLWPAGPQATIVDALHKNEEDILSAEVGPQRLAFYRGMNVNKVAVPDREDAETRLEYYFGEVSDRIKDQNPATGICGLTRQASTTGAGASAGRNSALCLTGQDAQGLMAITNLLSGIEPQFHAYTRELAASKLWLQQREAIGRPIAAAALAWAEEHHAITSKLESCGGMRALRQGCGNLTFGNLKLFVGRVKAIAAKGENNAGQ